MTGWSCQDIMVLRGPDAATVLGAKMIDHDRSSLQPTDVNQVAMSVPVMPVVGPIRFGSPFLSLDSSRRYSIGWRRWSDKKGGPGFMVVRLGSLGSVRILERFPLTDEGWARAAQALARLDGLVTEQVCAELQRRDPTDMAVDERARLCAASLGYMSDTIFLSGYSDQERLADSAHYGVMVRCGYQGSGRIS